jgi:hypothetical protein
MKRKRLFIPVMLGTALSVGSTLSEANSKLIHVTAHIVQQSFIGDPANPQLGDRIINNVDLFDDSGTKVGTGAGVCTIFSVPSPGHARGVPQHRGVCRGADHLGGCCPIARGRGLGAVRHFGWHGRLSQSQGRRDIHRDRTGRGRHHPHP